jgi:ATP-dependent DNA helicase RecG
MINDAPTLLATLCALPSETEWLEFKESRFDPEEVGKYVSALANSAMLATQAYA